MVSFKHIKENNNLASANVRKCCSTFWSEHWGRITEYRFNKAGISLEQDTYNDKK